MTMRDYANTCEVLPGMGSGELLWAIERAVRGRSRKELEALIEVVKEGPYNTVPERGLDEVLEKYDDDDEEWDEVAAYAAALSEGVRMAAAAGWCGGVRLLLAADAAVDVPDEKGNTPLLYAAHAGATEIVRLLLAAGANANTANAKGKTALMYAAEVDSPEVVQTLLAAGAEGAPRDIRGYTAFMYAAECASPEVMRLLLPTAPEGEVNACSAHGWTLLSLASMSNASDSVQLLLDLGAGVNTPGKGGMTPLMCATHRGVAGEPVLRTLILAGADPHQATVDGETSYSFAEQCTNNFATSLFDYYFRQARSSH